MRKYNKHIKETADELQKNMFKAGYINSHVENNLNQNSTFVEI